MQWRQARRLHRQPTTPGQTGPWARRPKGPPPPNRGPARPVGPGPAKRPPRVGRRSLLLVSHPIWYRSHHSLKLSCFISVIVWFVPLICAEIDPPRIYFNTLPVYSVFNSLIILCFADTWRGLSHTISLTALKRKLILVSLILMLLTYTLLILPYLIVLFIINYYEASRFLSKTTSRFNDLQQQSFAEKRVLHYCYNTTFSQFSSSLG